MSTEKHSMSIYSILGSSRPYIPLTKCPNDKLSQKDIIPIGKWITVQCLHQAGHIALVAQYNTTL